MRANGGDQQATPTQLGGAARTGSNDAGAGTDRSEKGHRSTNWLRDVILGGQDGLVNMLGIALGVVSASGSTEVLIATGLAATITESISMGAVAYTSSNSERDYYLAQREREERDIAADPDAERQ